MNNPHLDYDYPDGNNYGHCVFGSVVEGMGVVDSIAQTPTYDYSPYFGPVFKNFPDDPLVVVIQAYVKPCEISYCSNFSSDSRIDFEDFAMFALHWFENDCGSAGGFCDGADLNYSGAVDIADLELFIEHWSRTAGYEPVFSDFVTNGGIDVNDLFLFMTHWLDTGCNEENGDCGGADIDRSGIVNFADFSLFSNNWLATY